MDIQAGLIKNNIDRKRIADMVIKVLNESNNQIQSSNQPQISNSTISKIGVFSSINEAVIAAREAFNKSRSISQEKRYLVIETIREVGRVNAVQFAEMSVKETGLGRVECKVNKNLLVSEKTPGPELLKPVVFSGDHGLTLVERAPFGVIGSITPTTNPIATIINNSISMISAGNTVVFNVHPRAKNVSIYAIQLINKAIVAAGGPPNLLTTISEPNIQSAQELMVHPGVELILVTGGAEVVSYAMQSGKRAICAGPGNPPVLVDESADIPKAAHDIINSCAFDNNLVCADEKEVFVLSTIADTLKSAMCSNHAYEIRGDEINRIEKVIFSEIGVPGKPGKVNPKMVGQNASKILHEAGLPGDDQVKAIILEVPFSHPLVWTEQMMPVLPIVRVQSVDEGMGFALQAEHGFHHTAVMHSFNIEALSKMAHLMDTAIFVKNAPSFSGLGFEGEGYTSFSIGTKTGEGLTTCLTFTRERRCALVDYFKIV